MAGASRREGPAGPRRGAVGRAAPPRGEGPGPRGAGRAAGSGGSGRGHPRLHPAVPAPGRQAGFGPGRCRSAAAAAAPPSPIAGAVVAAVPPARAQGDGRAAAGPGRRRRRFLPPSPGRKPKLLRWSVSVLGRLIAGSSVSSIGTFTRAWVKLVQKSTGKRSSRLK